METAFTFGLRTTYDPLLLDAEPHYKLGRFKEDGTRSTYPDGAEYEGGAVWRTLNDALAYIGSGAIETFDSRSEDYAIYEIELPHSWGEDVDPTPKEVDIDSFRKGVYFELLHRARIVAKAVKKVE